MKIKTFIFFLFSFMMVFSQDIEEGLLLHYKFNNNFEDSSENGYDGTNHGVIFTEDRFGNENSAAKFNGIDSFIEFPNLTELKPQLPVSFSFWVKYDTVDAEDNYIFNTSFEENVSSGVYFNTQSSSNNYAVNFGDGTGDFTSNTRRTFVSNKGIDSDNWYHVSVIINSETDMKIYVDCQNHGGIHLGSGGELVYSDLPGNLGRGDRNTFAPPSYFKGSIDDFYYWEKELSESEIEDLCLFNPMNAEDLDSSELFIVPNPAKDFIEIRTTTINIKNYSIYSIDGKKVLDGELTSSTINISSLTSGSYFIKISSDKNTDTIKFVKQ